jgi:hypothetical protein
MLFRVCEHYEDEPEYNDNRECFICFEYKNNPIHLQRQEIYVNNCVCNSLVHVHCLKIWVDLYKTCPICRIKVIENNGSTVNNYIVNRNLSQRVIKTIVNFLFLYFFVDFCLEIKNVIHNHKFNKEF